MLSRGSFNGPGGPHSRWMIPATGGASMGAQHMLRNKIKLDMVDEAERAAPVPRGAGRRRAWWWPTSPPGGAAGTDSGLSGSTSLGDGDREPGLRREDGPLCDGGGYNNYTVEVVDRMGADSFTPDSGVLLAKTKNRTRRRSCGWSTPTRRTSTWSTTCCRTAPRPDHARRLPSAVGRAVPRRHQLGQRVRVRRQGQPLHFYVLDVKRDARGHPVLHGGGPLAGRRRPEQARREAAPGRRNPRRQGSVELQLPAVQHRQGRPGPGSTRRT